MVCLSLPNHLLILSSEDHIGTNDFERLAALKTRTSESRRNGLVTLFHEQIDPAALYFGGELVVMEHAARKRAVPDNFYCRHDALIEEPQIHIGEPVGEKRLPGCSSSSCANERTTCSCIAISCQSRSRCHHAVW
jgi:hypothetical protein